MEWLSSVRHMKKLRDVDSKNFLVPLEQVYTLVSSCDGLNGSMHWYYRTNGKYEQTHKVMNNSYDLNNEHIHYLGY
jgi:hypothetical protein